MKKIFNFMTLLAAVIALTACSSDTDYTPSENYILGITKSDVSFGPDAATGQIVVNTDQPITAVSSEEWCTASVSGNVVNVTVETHNGIDSRNAEITIKSGERSIEVPVHQSGIVLALNIPSSGLSVSDESFSQRLAVTKNAALTFSTSANWLSATLNGDSLTIAATANDTGHLRQGYIYYENESGMLRDSIKVVQCDFDTDIAGKIFYFAGLDLSEEEDVEIAEYGTFTKSDDGRYTFDFFQYGWSVPATVITPVQAQLSLSNDIGTYSVYTIGFVGWDLEQGYITWDSSISLDVNFYYDEEEGITLASIEDNGSWSGYYIEGIRFEAWNAAGTRLGSLESIGWPYLQEYVDDGEETPAKKSIKKKSNFKLNTAPVRVK